ncbi:cytochrome P450 [Sphingobacteriales bacterium UPWRP_1]|nr:hypothetical protein BVG80_12590 [Sphingobacteriales bacterium TSM_CSM]PSJ77865.1 cytochrome P450 [Sphingobacteriales bacterium UPWRP_1]
MLTATKTLPHVPIWRTLYRVNKIADNPIPFLNEGTKHLGDIFTSYIGPRKVIVTSNPEYIQHILQKNNKNYHKSKVVKEVLGSQLGQGLLTIDGDYWLKQRRLIQPGFYKQRLAELISIMTAETNDFCNELTRQVAQNPADDVLKLMMQLTFRIVNKALFSTALDNDKLHRVDYIITNLQKYVITMARQPYLYPWLKLSGKVAFYESLRRETDDIVYGIIKERREQKSAYNDLLDMLINSRYEDTGEGMNNKQLRDESMILIVAGHETSANALAWALYLISQHPEVEQKLLEEAATVLGNRTPAFEDLPNLQYTRQVIQETMRLYPPAWIIDRTALEDDEVDGYKIPKDCILLLFIYGTHHSPKYWKDPETFNPDRFSKENLKDLPNYAYFPFGGGPRLCIGNNFALFEMQIVLATLLRQFTFSLQPGQTIDLQPLVTLRPRYGVQMNIAKRIMATGGQQV